MRIVLWFLAILSIQNINVSPENDFKNVHVGQTEFVYFQFPERLKIDCGLKIEFDCDHFCSDSISIPKSSLVMAQFTIPDKSYGEVDYFKSILPDEYRLENGRLDISNCCLTFLKEKLTFPENIDFSNELASFNYEVRIFTPDLANNSEDLKLVSSDIIRTKSYQITFSQAEYDSLLKCN